VAEFFNCTNVSLNYLIRGKHWIIRRKHPKNKSTFEMKPVNSFVRTNMFVLDGTNVGMCLSFRFQITDVKEIEEHLREGEARVELACHYNNPYPRPVRTSPMFLFLDTDRVLPSGELANVLVTTEPESYSIQK
jgi:hypothetical protein